MAHKPSRSKRARPSRSGRRSRAEQERILADHGWPVVRELQSHPLRQPVDPGFEPYYRRVLAGNLRAVLEYCDANRFARRFDPSFYELVGRLATMRFYAAADRILCDIENRETYPTALDSARSRYEELKPLCDRARQFVQNERNGGSRVRLEELWRKYVFQPLPKAHFARFAGEPEEQTLQNEENARQQQTRRQAIVEMLTWSESEPEPRLVSQLDRFAAYHLVPKDIFLQLAERQWDGKPTWKPSQVARRWAACVAGISESTLTHKNGRK